MRFPVTATLAAAILISGCNQQPPTTSEAAVQTKASSEAPLDQANLCEVKEWTHDAVRASCTPGQKVVFLPGSWGNEQLPVIFAAVNCDMRYNVALTNGGVTCIYGPITLKPAPAEPTNQEPAAKGKS